MKKNFFILIIFIAIINLFSLHSYAQEKFGINLIKNENYLILTNRSVIDLISNNKNSMTFEVLTTLYNERNQILLRPLKDGTYRLYVTLDNNDFIILEVNIDKKNEKLDVQKSKYIKSILKLDVVASKKNEEIQFELDEPPILKQDLKGVK